ncbi:hypothetical protein QOT17_003384 [Balamuthia mandrillaris]
MGATQSAQQSEDLFAAVLQEGVRRSVVSSGQAEQLLQLLQQQLLSSSASPLLEDVAASGLPGSSFHLSHVLYYLGGLVAVSSMTAFLAMSKNFYGNKALLGLTSAYACVGLAATSFLDYKGYGTPAAVLATFTVSLVPVLTYGVQETVGFFASPYDNNGQLQDRTLWRRLLYADARFLPQALITLAASLLMFRHYRYPLLTLPMSAAAFFAVWDALPIISSSRTRSNRLSTTQYLSLRDMPYTRSLMLCFGVAYLALARVIEKHQHVLTASSEDYSLWLFCAGALCTSVPAYFNWFWGDKNDWRHPLLHSGLVLLGLVWKRSFVYWTGLTGVVAGLFGLIVTKTLDSPRHRGNWPLHAAAITLVDLAMAVVGPALGKKHLSVFGGANLLVLLAVVSGRMCSNRPFLFTAALTGLGLGTVVSGVVFRNNEDWLASLLSPLGPILQHALSWL